MISRILIGLAVFGLTAVALKFTLSSTAISAASGLYPVSGQESASIAVALAEDGASHAALTGYDGATKDLVYYATCAGGDCAANADAWRKATISMPGAQKVQLKLTKDGRPRLLITSRTGAEEPNVNRRYIYGECEADCTEATNWRFVTVAKSGDHLLSEIFALTIPDRTFALDGQDRPRFIFNDANYFIEPDHYGAFVMSCDTACTEAGNWKETDLALHLGNRHEQFTRPVLAAADNGTLGVIANVYAFDAQGNELPSGLYYYGCASDCTETANWQRARVNETGSGSYPSPTWDLAMTADGRPRIAQFMGDGTEQEDLSHELVYLWCDEACGIEKSWSGNRVQPGKGVGESPDLVLDPSGAPRIASVTDHGELALSACDADCETEKPRWRSDFAERIGVPQTERPQALPFHCDGELWNGLMPSLSLRQGGAVIGYDLIVSARCLYKDFQEPVPQYTFHEIFHGTRLATAPLPREQDGK